ncbi:tyrosine--tRNA ligase, cytoplasmic-like [Lycorma delicatula]|uniref:tyrosine--tRNA ligase, cytoplasmic-like n=1 Tax=Lycorma delicatula TaxID=130591 RepID=UPI003F50F091
MFFIFISKINIRQLIVYSSYLSIVLFEQVCFCRVYYSEEYFDDLGSNTQTRYVAKESCDYYDEKSSNISFEYVAYKPPVYKDVKYNLSDSSRDDDKEFSNIRKQNINEVAKIIRRVNFSTLDLRICKIIDVDFHPNHKKYYIFTLDVGQRNFRQSVSGARPYYRRIELMSRQVICLINIKSRKIHGVSSNAIVLYGLQSDLVEILQPPIHSSIGDLVYTTRHIPRPAKLLYPYKYDMIKIFKSLHVEHFIAYYNSVPWLVMGRKLNYVSCKNLSYGEILEPVFN